MKSPKRTASGETAGKKTSADAGGTTSAIDAVELLKQDHRNVEALFKEFKTADQTEKGELVRRLCNELIVHAMLEEEIFYKECRDRGVESNDLDEAQVEHDGAKVLIRDLLSDQPGSAFYDAKVTVLSEYIKHHVGEEEKAGEGIFAKAKKHGLDMSALGQRLQARKQELMQKAEANELGPPSSRALNLQSSQDDQEYSTMARYSNDRDRDERGRFMSDDDDDRRYSRSRSSSRYEDDDDRGSRGRSSSRYDDEDGRGGRGRGGSGWYGDSEGHSQAARSRGGSSRSGEDYDDDRGGDRGRGRGWFGDSEGHSAAARQRGQDDDRSGGRSSSRSGSRYDDDDDRSGGRSSSRSSSRYDDDDDRGGGRGSRSRSSSRSDDDDERNSAGRNRGRSGWFGDSEGHAEAARQRWEDDDHSGGSRSARSRSSNRSDDDDGRSRGHGGWFGDSEGHSRASRRGWRDRD